MMFLSRVRSVVTLVCIHIRELYYTDWGQQAQVARVNLDGTEPLNLGTHFENPNSVLTDGDTVYVVDSHVKSRERGLDVNGAIYWTNRTGSSWANISGIDLQVCEMVSLREGGREGGGRGGEEGGEGGREGGREGVREYDLLLLTGFVLHKIFRNYKKFVFYRQNILSIGPLDNINNCRNQNKYSESLHLFLNMHLGMMIYKTAVSHPNIICILYR